MQPVAVPENLNAITVECSMFDDIAFTCGDSEPEVVFLIDVGKLNVNVYVFIFRRNDEGYHPLHRELFRGVVHVAIDGVIPYCHAFIVIV